MSPVPDPRQILPPWLDDSPAPYALPRHARALADPPWSRARRWALATACVLLGILLGVLMGSGLVARGLF